MSVHLTQPVDGSAAYLEDEKGRRQYFPAPTAAVVAPSAHGESCQVGEVSEEITLATGGLTTDSTANLLPANSIILGVVARVTQAITVTTNWALGDGTTPARFLAATTDLTLGTTKVGLAHRNPADTDAAGPVQASAAKLRITCTGSNPGAGKVRVTVFYRQFVAPAS